MLITTITIEKTFLRRSKTLIIREEKAERCVHIDFIAARNLELVKI